MSRTHAQHAAALGIIMAVLLLLGGCSSVFTTYITGEVIEDKPDGDPIEGAYVYLYSEEGSRDADYAAWTDSGKLPHELERQNYFLSSKTDNDGSFSFSGFTWKTLNPEFGKTADRQEIHLLVYKDLFGLAKVDRQVFVVSEVTNYLVPITISRIMNTAFVKGEVTDDAGDPLENVQVDIYLPEQWSYQNDGTITVNDDDWAEEPLRVFTNADGEYSRTISFKPKPSLQDNRKSTVIRVVYARDGYVAEEANNPVISDTGFDADGDGDDNPYYELVINDQDTRTLDTILMTPAENNASVTVKVRRTGTSEAIEQVNVRVYLAREWEYDNGTVDTITWRENPSAQGATGAGGEVTLNLTYPRKPSVHDNRGTVPARVVIERNNFTWTDTLDSDAAWEPANFPEDNDGFHELELMHNNTHELRFEMKETLFENQRLWGYIEDGNSGTNNLRVGLVLDPDDSITPDKTTPSTVNVYTTRNGPPSADFGEQQPGYYTFSNITWEDTAYTESYSRIRAHLLIDDDRSGEWDRQLAIWLYSHMTDGNYEEIANYTLLDPVP